MNTKTAEATALVTAINLASLAMVVMGAADMTTFYIALPWAALFIAACAEIKSDGVCGFATLMLVLAVFVFGFVTLGAKLGGAA